MAGVLAALPQLQTKEEGQVLFYPAAGFDWKVPLSLLRLSRRNQFPKLDLAIYVDYSSRLAWELEQASIKGDNLYWGPDTHVASVVQLDPPSSWIWKLRSQGAHAPDGGSITGEHWYFIDLRIAKYSLSLLYVPADAVAFASEVLAPLKIRATYVATVTDGCRLGGNWCCLSKRKSPFYRALKNGGVLPDYWLTDHGDLDYPAVARVKTGLYGNGESKLLAVH